MKLALTLVILVLFFGNCLAIIESDSMKVFAVTDSGRAMSADLVLNIKTGSGRIWTSVEPLVGTSTQSTEKLAIEIARDYSTEVEQYDYFFEIKSDASLVDGPSAGAAMTLLAISMLQDRPIPDEVSMTGTITAGGGVGPVGGVFEKSKEAARIGMKLFMIPPGESRQTVKIEGSVQSVNLVDYAESNWGMKVVEVDNIDDVLFYAFSDIEEIDVNASGQIAAEFVPKQIELDEILVPMKDLTARYISKAEDKIRSAKTALSGTLLNQPEIIDAMLTSLNESEKTLDRSKILYEQNYLYSAANYAFLAMVNAQFVEDVAENPMLLSQASTAFDNKVIALDKDIDRFAVDLNRYVTIDYFGWHVAAKERLAWAKLKTNALREHKGIVIIVEENGVDVERISQIMDYEYALAWYEVSKGFFELTRNSKRAVLIDNALLPRVDFYISNTENSLPALSEDETDDIMRRLDGAKIAKEYGWTYSALYDSSSALALANAKVYIKNKDLDELQAELHNKIESLEAKIDEKPENFVWSQLYTDHAKYYLDGSLFYQQQGQTGLALSSAQSGVELAFLAEGVFDAADESYDHFSTLPFESFVPLELGWQIQPGHDSLVFAIGILVFSILFIVAFGLLASGKKFHILKPFSFEDMLNEILMEQRRLRKRMESGYLTESQFDQLNAPIQRRVNRLLSDRKAISSDYVELDLNNCKVIAFERALHDLNLQLRKKQITKEDYSSNAAFYKKRIDLLKHIIEEGQKKIESEKEKAEEEFSEKERKKAKRRKKK